SSLNSTNGRVRSGCSCCCVMSKRSDSVFGAIMLKRSALRNDLTPLLVLALLRLALHLLLNTQYGFHRDELQVLDDARHLDWGYVPYPPLTPFFGWIELHLFGTTLTGFRFFAALAQCATMVLAGLIARELGGRRLAVLLAAGATATMPFSLVMSS